MVYSQQVHGVLRYAKVQHCTHTCSTHFGNTTGKPVPMQNPRCSENCPGKFWVTEADEIGNKIILPISVRDLRHSSGNQMPIQCSDDCSQFSQYIQILCVFWQLLQHCHIVLMSSLYFLHTGCGSCYSGSCDDSVGVTDTDTRSLLLVQPHPI